jgi:hypothetical protein
VSAMIGTSHGRRAFSDVPRMLTVLLTRDEVMDLAALRARQAAEAEREGKHDIAERLFSRATALRETSR